MFGEFSSKFSNNFTHDSDNKYPVDFLLSFLDRQTPPCPELQSFPELNSKPDLGFLRGSSSVPQQQERAPPPGMDTLHRGRASGRFQRGRGRSMPKSNRFARPEDPPVRQRFEPSPHDAKFDARDPTRFLQTSPRIKPISPPPVKAKPPDHREIEVGITRGPEDNPDVLLERKSVEVGKHETFRSLTARLLEKSNFSIVNLKNLEGYLLKKEADDVIFASRPVPKTIWLEVEFLEASKDTMEELFELRMRDASYHDQREQWREEKENLTMSIEMLQQEKANDRRDKEDARRRAQELRQKVIQMSEQKQQDDKELKIREQRIYQLDAENARFISELQRFKDASAKSGDAEKLKQDLNRREKYITHLTEMLSDLQQKNTKLKLECDGLRGDLEKQRQQYISGPAPNTPHFVPPPKKIKQMQRAPPAAPAPKGFPGKKTGWSAAIKTQNAAPKVARTAPPRAVKRPQTVEKPGVNTLEPRVLQRPSSGISFASLQTGGEWQTSNKTVKNPNKDQMSLDQFGSKNLFDFSGEHNQKKKKKKKKKSNK